MIPGHEPPRLASTADAVYAAFTKSGSGPAACSTRIARFDVRTGGVVRSRVLYGGFDLAANEESLWVSGTPVCSGSLRRLARSFLYRLDPRTLAIEARIKLPDAPGPMAFASAGLWVGARRRLYLLDSGTGGVRKVIPVRGDVNELAVDPTGRFLYVAAWNGANGFVNERDARSGALLQSARELFGYPANWLSPTREGVWVSTATGNFGAAILLRNGNLQRGPLVEANQGVKASVAADHLWVQNDGETLRCLDPASGRIQATVTAPEGGEGLRWFLTNVVGAGRFVFVGGFAGLVRITPPQACS